MTQLRTKYPDLFKKTHKKTSIPETKKIKEIKIKNTAIVHEKTTLTTKDMFGKKITKGTIITYPVRQGSAMWMSVAKVIDIYQKQNYLDETQTILKVMIINKKNKISRVERIDRTVVISKKHYENN